MQLASLSGPRVCALQSSSLREFVKFQGGYWEHRFPLSSRLTVYTSTNSTAEYSHGHGGCLNSLQQLPVWWTRTLICSSSQVHVVCIFMLILLSLSFSLSLSLPLSLSLCFTSSPLCRVMVSVTKPLVTSWSTWRWTSGVQTMLPLVVEGLCCRGYTETLRSVHTNAAMPSSMERG